MDDDALERRSSGLPAVGELSWGTHLCQLYGDDRDLRRTLVPYFQAGLESHERCLWIACERFDARQGRAALAAVVPDLSERIRGGQIEIIDGEEGDSVAELGRWLDREAAARRAGFAGLRIGDTCSRLDFSAHEALLHHGLHDRRIVALCAYGLGDLGEERIAELIRSHDLALVKRRRWWNVVRGAVLAASSTHGVELYADEASFPAAHIAEVVAAGLADGEAGLVVATPAHADGIRAALGELGVTPDHGELVFIDAEELFRAVSRRPGLDPAVLDERVRTLVDALLARRPRLRAYGELVEVFCRQGDSASALLVEEWWNRLLEDRPVSLLCGYSLGSFEDTGTCAVFDQVCSLHDTVVPARSSVPPVMERDRLVAQLQQASRALAREATRRSQLESVQQQLVDAERRSAEHLADLQSVTSALSEAATQADIAEVIASRIADMLGAERAQLVPPSAAGADALPLMVKGRLTGAIALSYGEGRLPGVQRALAEDLARQVALALDRARVYEEAKAARDRLQLLAESSARISSARLDLAEVLAVLGAEVRRVGFAERCEVELADELRPGSLAVVAEPFRLVVPLRAGGQAIGVLTATRSPPAPPYSGDDRQVLQELADRAALSVENAMLFERVERERRRAEAANLAKDEFLAMLGHELRNPLSPILTALQLMRLRGGDGLLKERTIIERQVEHMTCLVDDLLDVSRITRGKVELKRRRIELAQVVARAVEIASPMMEQRAHKLLTRVAPSGLPVHVDPARLAQVVANLLTNAAKYTPPGGRVEVDAEVVGARCILTVSDTGIGLEAELLPRVFELFVQGRQALDRSQGGLGLGLAIARTLVEMHGGTIRADSDGPGQGSEFSIELPLCAGGDEEQLARRSSPTVPSRAVSGRRVLVVDDYRDGAEAMSEALRELGYLVEVAHDGPSALQAARAFEPEVALLDLGLPVMDGFELARRLAVMSERPPRLIAVTGYGQKADRKRTREAGFHEHVTKPVDLGRLDAAIDRVLRSGAPSEA